MEKDPNKLCYKAYQNLNHYFLAHQNAIPLTLIKCNGFAPIMTRSPLNPGLLEVVVVGLTFLAFLDTLCNTIDTNYITTPAYPTSETTLPSFQPRMTPALLFGYQRPPPAPNIAPQINPQPCPSLVSSKKLTRILFAITTFPSFQPWTTPALLFGCQRPPPAPNIASQINLQPCPSLVSSKKLMWILCAITTPNKGFKEASSRCITNQWNTLPNSLYTSTTRH